MPPVFRTIVKTSWNTLWDSPWILLFGFFASFLSIGGFWDVVFNIRQGNALASAEAMSLILAFRDGSVQAFFAGLLRSITDAPRPLFSTVFVLSLALVLMVGVFWLANCGQGAIIDTTRKKMRGMKTTVRAAWAVGRRSAWPLFWLNLGLRLAILLLFLLLGLLVSLTASAGSVGTILSFIGLLVAIPAALLLALIALYAANAIVIKGFSIQESIRYGLTLFLHHWLLSLEMATLFFFLGLLFGICTVLAATLLALPFFLLTLIATVFSLPGSIQIIFILWLLVVVLLIIAMTSLFTAWQTTAWTLLFLRLEGTETPRPFLVRLTQKFFP